MGKTLTVSIAAYNVQEFIEDTLKSVLVNNIDDLEVLVEDDGGTDKTADIVKKYEKMFPGIVKLIHKENGGYGSTINKSIEIAQGKYFKQLDGDDWFDSENFERLLDLLRSIDVDVLYAPNYEYREKSKSKEVVDFFDKEIEEGIYDFEDIIDSSKDVITMHRILYKTEILRKSNLQLFEKCLYTDTQFALFPIVNVKTIYISHEPIYVYRIGRAEQSISLGSHRKHYNEHERVTKSLIDFYNNCDDSIGENTKKYIFKYVRIQAGITIVKFFMLLEPSKEALNRIIEFENYIKDENMELYEALAKNSKVINILRKSKYNYIVYKNLAKIKTSKIKKELE